MLSIFFKAKPKIAGAAFALGLSLASIASASQPDINELVVFGDSVSDNGTLSQLTQGQAPETFTNGQVWTDYLSESLSAHQVNMAIAGAHVAGHDSQELQQLAKDGAFSPFGINGLGLKGQVDSYLRLSAGDQSKTLHTILIGGNDILAFLQGQSAFTERKPLVDHIVGQITSNIERLVQNGAKNILVMTLPDISQSPLFRLPGFQNKQALANRLTVLVNNRLTDDLYVQRRRSNAEYNIFTVNGNQLSNRVLHSGEYENTEGTWLVLNENRQPTGEVNGHPDQFIFWDNIHPTTRVHKAMADNAYLKLQQQAYCLGNNLCQISRDIILQ